MIRNQRLPQPRNYTHCPLALIGGIGAACLVVTAAPQTALAQRIENQTAVFAALDKVTARISRLEIKLGDTARFGALKITPRTCYSRPPDLPPKTSTFVEVRELQLDSSEKRIFSGWMFAENPGLNAVEHPVYDVWLTECAAPKAVPGRASTPGVASNRTGNPAGAASSALGANGNGAPDPAAPAEDDFRRRRPPR